MTTLSIYSATVGQFEQAVSSFASNLIAAVKREFKAARTFDELSALTSAELRDIGITRGEIRSISYNK